MSALEGMWHRECFVCMVCNFFFFYAICLLINLFVLLIFSFFFYRLVKNLFLVHIITFLRENHTVINIIEIYYPLTKYILTLIICRNNILV